MTNQGEGDPGKAGTDVIFTTQLEQLVEGRKAHAITEIIDDLEAKIADMEGENEHKEAMELLRKRKALAEAARERAWTVQGKG